MGDQGAAMGIGDVTVPTLAGAVLNDEVLVAVHVAHHLVGHIGALALLVPHRQSVVGVGRGREQVDPAHEVLLIGIVAARSVAVVVVAAIVHQAP